MDDKQGFLNLGNKVGERESVCGGLLMFPICLKRKSPSKPNAHHSIRVSIIFSPFGVKVGERGLFPVMTQSTQVALIHLWFISLTRWASDIFLS